MSWGIFVGRLRWWSCISGRSMQVLGASCTPGLTFPPSCHGRRDLQHGGDVVWQSSNWGRNSPVNRALTQPWMKILFSRLKKISLLADPYILFKFSLHGYSECIWQQGKESHVKTWRKVTPSHVSRSAFRQNLIWGGGGGGEAPVPGQASFLLHQIREDTKIHVARVCGFQVNSPKASEVQLILTERIMQRSHG